MDIVALRSDFMNGQAGFEPHSPQMSEDPASRVAIYFIVVELVDGFTYSITTTSSKIWSRIE